MIRRISKAWITNDNMTYQILFKISIFLPLSFGSFIIMPALKYVKLTLVPVLGFLCWLTDYYIKPASPLLYLSSSFRDFVCFFTLE
jgi:hypothetical protein